MTENQFYEKIQKRVESLEKELRNAPKVKEFETIGEISNALLNASITAAFLLDLKGTILAANETFAKGMGKSLNEIIGRRTDEFILPEVHENRRSQALKVIQTGKPVRFEDEHEERFYDVNIHPIFDANGMVKYLAVSSQDITERKRAEEALKKSNDALQEMVEDRTAELEKMNKTLNKKVKELKKAQKALAESERQYRSLAEHMKDVLFVQDMNLNIAYVSPSVTALFGYTVEESLKLKMEDLMTPDSLKKAFGSFQEMAARAAEKKRDLDIPFMEYEYIRKDGSTFWGELKVSFLWDSKGHLAGTQGILRNIDQKKKAEEALRQSEFKFRSLFDLSPQAIALTEIETGRLIDVNHRFCELTKYRKHEILGKSTIETGFYSRKNRERFLKGLKKSGELHGLEMEFKTKDGAMIQAQMYAKLIQFNDKPIILTVFYDMTEENRLRSQFQKAQRMEAIGNLAGGIAHDFNNLLMGIQGNASLMLLETGDNHPHNKMLKNIENHVKSGAKLTRQLLDYARKGRYEVRPVDLNRMVEETLESFHRAMRQIQVHQDLASDLSAIDADSSQIEQVLLNLFVNAADAMPGGGKLFLETRNVTDQDMEGRSYKPKKGNYVLLTVTDTGIGMDNEIQERIFEPFFTTKELGKGTGLGLASVYGIIKGHGGYIDVESQIGRGAAFKVYLPASNKKVETRRPFSRDIVRGKGTVFIVDDEKTILDVESKMLEQLGYETFRAESGEQALKFYRENQDKIDLMILDLIMPDMQGGAVYDVIKEINPDVKVLLSSGYSVNGEANEILKRGCNGFIQKPFDIKTLSHKIGEMLGTN